MSGSPQHEYTHPATIGDTVGADDPPQVNPRFPNVDLSTFRSASKWYVPQDSTPHGDSGSRPHPIDTTTPQRKTQHYSWGGVSPPLVPLTKNDRLANCTSVGTTLQDSQLRLTTSLSFIHACGYQLFSPEIEDDVIPCYGAIQLLQHKKIKMAWTNTRTLQSGPSVERILEKGLAVLPKLRGTSAREAVSFYECL